MFFKLAWRNIWRNKVRTGITMAAVFIAVILSSLMVSLKDGIFDNMIDAMVGDFVGYTRVHHPEYMDDKTIDRSFAINDSLKQVFESDNVIAFMPRIESFTLSAYGDRTKPVQVVGIDVEKEKQFRELHKRVSEGQYLKADEHSVLLGDGLASNLGIGVGDTIILIGQGYHGANAVGAYPVRGLVKFGSPELSKVLLFMPVQTAGHLFDLNEMYSTIVLELKDPEDAVKVADELSLIAGSEYTVLDWKELVPELLNLIATEDAETYVFMFILYMVISFGIFGTMLMMLSERSHEFGVLVAVGMKRVKLAFMVWLEVINISLLGAFIGVAAAFPVCYYFYYNPIMLGGEMGKMYEEYGMAPMLQSSVEPMIFIEQGIIVFIIASIISLYPFIVLLRLNAIKAMRS